MSWFDRSKYFKSDQDDFDSPDLEGSRSEMNSFFLSKLEKARSYSKVAFKVSSGFRTKSHNKKVGGVNASSHTIGRAVDLIADSDYKKYKIITALMKAGFNRIGVAKNFIHVDDDISKNPGRLWTY